MIKRLLRVALAASLLGGVAATVQTTADAPPARAGINYWSHGCNPTVQWFRYSGSTQDIRMWTSRDRDGYSGMIQYGLENVYAGQHFECGWLGALLGSERRVVGWEGRGNGWVNDMENGHIFWDEDCTRGYVRYYGRYFYENGWMVWHNGWQQNNLCVFR